MKVAGGSALEDSNPTKRQKLDKGESITQVLDDGSVLGKVGDWDLYCILYGGIE